MRVYSKSLNPIGKPINPYFSVHRNGVQQSNITGTDKIEWTTELFDTNNNFDSSTNYRFTPTIAGPYVFSVSTRWISASITGGDVCHLGLYKNGTLTQEYYKYIANVAGTMMTLVTISEANGTTDYFEVFATNDARDTGDLDGAKEYMFWTGSRIG